MSGILAQDPALEDRLSDLAIGTGQSVNIDLSDKCVRGSLRDNARLKALV